VPAAIDALPEVVAAVGGRAEILLDSGVRRGTDVVKAVALGARACMIGRPWLYGLALDGADGVFAVLELLREEIDRTLALVGRPRLTELDASAVAAMPLEVT
jgi:L-lactate dehydrogenase (cytochrome)